jgi:hypothetical protein
MSHRKGNDPHSRCNAYRRYPAIRGETPLQLPGGKSEKAQAARLGFLRIKAGEISEKPNRRSLESAAAAAAAKSAAAAAEA